LKFTNVNALYVIRIFRFYNLPSWHLGIRTQSRKGLANRVAHDESQGYFQNPYTALLDEIDGKAARVSPFQMWPIQRRAPVQEESQLEPEPESEA
jgi:hypothetical protein